MLFGCVTQNINDSSEKLKLIYIKNFLSYAIKTSELKNNYREVGGGNSSSLKTL